MIATALLLLASITATANCDGIFSNGFESGDLSAWESPLPNCLCLSPEALSSVAVDCAFPGPGTYAVRLQVCSEDSCDEVVRMVVVDEGGS